MGFWGGVQDLMVAGFNELQKSENGRLAMGLNMTPNGVNQMYAMQARRARERAMERSQRAQEERNSQRYNASTNTNSSNDDGGGMGLGLGVALVAGLGGLAVSMLSKRNK